MKVRRRQNKYVKNIMKTSYLGDKVFPARRPDEVLESSVANPSFVVFKN